MGFQPALHPNVATLRLPDFDEFHDGLAVRAGQGVIAKAGFDALPPGDRVSRFGKRGQVKERELQPEGIESLLHFGEPYFDYAQHKLGFDIAGIKTGMTQKLQAL